VTGNKSNPQIKPQNLERNNRKELNRSHID